MPLVEVEDRGPVRHVVMNRAEKRNALNDELGAALGAGSAEACHDESVRVGVLRGEGPMFSAGMGRSNLRALSENPDNLRPFRSELIRWWNLLEEMPKATIAQIHGGAIGGAVELALAGGKRVVAGGAITGMVETRIGLIPDVGGSSRLPAVVGLGLAKELIMAGKLVDGREAFRIGFANRIAPAEELDAATDQLVNELLACAPRAVGLAKRLL